MAIVFTATMPMGVATATTHTLRQTIYGDNRCDYTDIAVAVGKKNAQECEPFAPTIDIEGATIDDGGRLTIRGVYDAVHADGPLIVELNGKAYTSGPGGAIQTDGNVWTLVIYISTAAPSLQSGKEYAGTVAATTKAAHSGAVREWRTLFTLRVPIVPAVTDPADPIVDRSPSPSLPQQIAAALANTGQSLPLIITGAIGTIAIAVWLLLQRRKREGRGGG
ncbi:MAG: hypothetical protein Q4A34_02535 [Candidatus Saccharibacteria bacterium]|nr:hypothetical protein [Candidatus Saccharibacteria bacterium]